MADDTPPGNGQSVMNTSSPSFWKIDASVIVTVIVLGGFCLISWMAMKPEIAGVKESVVLYLLGAWQSMAAAAVAYWIGSSASSKAKDATIAETRVR
jgi:hypothetical protein